MRQIDLIKKIFVLDLNVHKNKLIDWIKQKSKKKNYTPNENMNEPCMLFLVKIIQTVWNAIKINQSNHNSIGNNMRTFQN